MLARAASFSRRSKRAPTDPTSGQKENDSQQPAAAKGIAAKIVRSASFSRRAAKKGANARGDDTDENSRATTPDSGSSPDSPADLAFPTYVPTKPEEWQEPEPPAILSDCLFGFLKKQSRNGKWKKRYFYVDESRGTLSYAKNVKQRGTKPSAVLPIADMTRLEPCEDEPSAFRIACPPVHLTVMCVSVKERKHWMKQLELRRDVWAVRQRDKMPVADVNMLMRQASQERAVEVQRQLDCYNAPAQPAHAALPKVVAVPMNQAQAAQHDRTRPREPTREGANSLMPSSSKALIPRPAVPEPEPLLCVASSPAAEPRSRRARRQEEAAAAAAAEDVSDPLDLSAGEAPASEQQEAPEEALPSRLLPATPTEAQEIIYDDEDGEPSPSTINSANRVDSANRFAVSPLMREPAPVPLAALISSDEDEDEDEDEIDEPPAGRRQYLVARGAMDDRDDRDGDEALDEAADAPPPLPLVADHEPASAANWDSDEEDDVDVRMPGTISTPFGAQMGAGMDEARPSPVEMMNDANNGLIAPEEEAAEPELPMVMAAPGIVADSNFIEDDWDDDDM